jgi:outer membrane protein OmpA-like peptidoglycan-associated protein
VQTKVGEVADQANKQGTDIAATRQDVAKNTTAIQATDEKATGAGRRADDAMAKANQVDQKADQNARDLGQLRTTIANLDDYKVVNQGTVLFGLNRATLTPESKQQLDQLVANAGSMKRYFIAVEGYADSTGNKDYNLELSKRRAEAVVTYLAGEKDVDFNHIHVIGLGTLRPVDPGKNREARAKNRRVEVKVYSADDALAPTVSQR